MNLDFQHHRGNDRRTPQPTGEQMTNETSTERKTVVISGGGTGIGQAVARHFASVGWSVAVGGRRQEPLQETTGLIQEDGGTCIAYPLDICDKESIERFFTHAESEVGPVDAVINNAATARYGPLADFSPDEIALEINTKLVESLLMARRGIQALQSRGAGGDILFVTSTSAAHPWPYHLPYASANAGVEHGARSLRLELEGSGIRVSVPRCGETMGTDFSTRELGNPRFDAAQRAWFRQGLLRHGGLMTPKDVAAAIVGAVTLPPTVQFGFLEVTPTAPAGPLPDTYDDFIQEMIERHMPDRASDPA